MLERRSAANGVVYYASPLFERASIPHAFSTRIGGLSPAPFDSLNLGNPSGCDVADDYERIGENYRRLAVACGCPTGEVLRVHQVHGGVVVHVASNEKFDTAAKADAIVSGDPRRVASVRVADCVPVLLATRDGKMVAAVHAGWRGVIAGVATNTLRILLGVSGGAEGILAAIGPCIGYGAFEVGPEVILEFRRHFGDSAPLRTIESGKGYIDLREAIRLQLIAAGLGGHQIDQSDRCTYRNQEEFFSHRRDNGITGRMAAIISARAS